jgi:serine O-acetyltransferase
MFEELTQDYPIHASYTFLPEPQGTWRERWAARLDRLRVVVLVMNWIPVLLYRLRVWCKCRHVPILPYACDLLARAGWSVYIGEHVEIAPGLYLAHGNVVIDGIVKIGRNCEINPWVTLGLSNSKRLVWNIHGPTIGDNVSIGTGAKVLGPITVGNGARIGANAVVLADVPAGATAVGVPARVVSERAPSRGTGPASGDEGEEG